MKGPSMKTATEAIRERDERDRDERSLKSAVERFTERWTDSMDGRQRAEFHADLVLVIQAVHRDASRTTNELLMRAMQAMPPAPIFVEKKPNT